MDQLKTFEPKSFSKDRLLYLDNLRAVAIGMVVGIHAFGYCLPLPELEYVVIKFIVDLVAVPAFFLVDGYLFSYKVKREEIVPYKRSIANSVFRLLVPWITFTILYLVARGAFEWLGYLQEKIIIGRPLSYIATAAYGSVYAGQLYFLFSLFLIRLATPIWRRLSDGSFATLFGFFFAFAIGYAFAEPLLVSYLKVEGGQAPLLHALWGGQFYLFGIVLFRLSTMVPLQRLFIPSIVIFTLSLMIVVVMNYRWHVWIQYLYLLVFFLFFVRYYFSCSFLTFLGKNTMGIYLLHSPVILKILSLFINKYIHFPLFNYLFLLILAFFGSLGLSVLLVKFPYGKVLLGERCR